ncbi:MAG: choice-of-anchor R domain-containing protein, partial [Planctomycetota bacterium]
MSLTCSDGIGATFIPIGGEKSRDSQRKPERTWVMVGSLSQSVPIGTNPANSLIWRRAHGGTTSCRHRGRNRNPIGTGQRISSPAFAKEDLSMILRAILSYCLLSILFAGDSTADLVSNLSEPSDGGSNGLGVNPGGFNDRLSNSFTTGSNPLGYNLDAITLRMSDAFGTPSGFSLELFSVPDSVPDGSLLTFTGDNNPAVAGDYTYTTPGFFLTPNTTYAWVASAPNSP